MKCDVGVMCILGVVRVALMEGFGGTHVVCAGIHHWVYGKLDCSDLWPKIYSLIQAIR